jgi:hypothetical protein
MTINIEKSTHDVVNVDRESFDRVIALLEDIYHCNNRFNTALKTSLDLCLNMKKNTLNKEYSDQKSDIIF